MSNRSWYFAADGKQRGPYPEPEFRNYIANGAIRGDTLVWAEGMANWQKAGDISGLLDRSSWAASMAQAGAVSGVADSAGGTLAIDFEIWEWVWRHIVLLVGTVLIIPAPWALTMYFRWLASRVRVSGRPNLTFDGRASTLIPFVVAALAFFLLFAFVVPSDIAQSNHLSDLVSTLVNVLISWLLIRWFVVNLASNETPLGLSFSGSFWGFLGWTLLLYLSILTIIGWAWVYAAQLRWMCRHVEGTRRQVVFNGTGLEILWRSLVTFLAAVFIIPIPWVVRWFLRWLASQIALVPRGQLRES
jgi:hypothetical protein